MKAKLYFAKQKGQAKIENEAFNEFIEKLPDDLEIPDVAVNLLEDSFLTRERAMADPKILKKIKAETLNGADEALKKVIATLDPEYREEFEKEENTYKKIENLSLIIPKVKEKAGTQAPNTDEKVKQLEKSVQEFADKVKSINKEKEDERKRLLEQFESEKSGMKLDWTLDKQLGKYNFAPEYTGLKEAIIKNAVTDLRSKHTLQLSDNGEIVIVDIDPQTKVATPKFNGNDPVTIESVLLPTLDPFLKKNNKGDDTTKEQQQQRQAQQSGATSQARMFNEERRRAKPNTPVV